MTTATEEVVPKCPDGPGSGQTQWMIDRLVEAIQDGQPKCVVIAHDRRFLIELRLRLSQNFPGTIQKPADFSLIVDGSRIEFVVASKFDEWKRGRHGYGEFWDHFAEEVHER